MEAIVVVGCRRLTTAETILCAALTLLTFTCFVTGTLDLAIWVAWKATERRRKS